MINKFTKEQLAHALKSCERKMVNANSVRFLIWEWIKLYNKENQLKTTNKIKSYDAK